MVESNEIIDKKSVNTIKKFHDWLTEYPLTSKHKVYAEEDSYGKRMLLGMDISAQYYYLYCKKNMNDLKRFEVSDVDYSDALTKFKMKFKCIG